MASIYGIEIKGVKTFIGHEGQCAQGNLYLNGKKIGWWSQDSRGGPDEVDLSEGLSERKLNEAIIKRSPDKHKVYKRPDGSEIRIDYELEELICDLLGLNEREKAFKKAVKAGYKAVYEITDGYQVVRWNVSKTDYEKVKSDLEEQIKKDKECLFNGEPVEEFWCNSLDDFHVGNDQKITVEEVSV